MQDRTAARRLSEHGDVRRIAAVRADVLAHPLERGGLVEQSAVGDRAPLASAVRAERHPSERAEPVVDRHHDHIAVGREPGRVVRRQRRRADRERPAVDPDHHRQRGRRRASRP